MARLFLFGDIADNFAEISRPFVDAAISFAGGDAEIALLLQGGSGWEQYVGRYRDPWLRHGAGAVHPVTPGAAGHLDASALSLISRCTGIFVGGGDPAAYRRIYVDSAAREVIRARVGAGAPYGGVSAGAHLAGSTSILAGNHASDSAGPHRLAADFGDATVDLMLGDGFGLLPGVVIEAHFAEVGSFPRLIAALQRSTATKGLGFDEPIGVFIEGTQATILGRGRAYLVRPLTELRFEIDIKAPGDQVDLR